MSEELPALWEQASMEGGLPDPPEECLPADVQEALEYLWERYGDECPFLYRGQGEDYRHALDGRLEPGAH